ncbi:transcription factor [Ganoderma sinense ZZ0214-1]|uniref:Transcription factor n=1 Tax=Ganoderma sinense ZZ0214-1 TaxID=1077348 RepID=A0A2G8RVA7_9APHY|nr:transcription factor [Ganoderma sinense ZZ0214-1]
MSSPEESPLPAFKKPTLFPVRCDGPEMSDNRCSNCTTSRAECTYLQTPVSTNKYSKSYVEELENRLKRMEKFVSKLVPDTDAAKAFYPQHSNSRQSPGVLSEQPRASGSRGAELTRSSSPLIIAPTPPDSANDDAPSEDEEAELDEELTETMQKLSMHPQPFRYYGKSSGLVFVRSALALKNVRTGSGLGHFLSMDGQQPWLKTFVEDDFPVFEASVFPPRDLLHALVELYFRHMSYLFPLLHEPTFMQAVKAGLHLRNGGFGATVLLVCAIGSRFTHDPRVLLPESNEHPYSAGWKWFSAVEKARRLSFAPAGLHDLQVYALMGMFLYGSNAPAGLWTVVGAGIRAAVEVGVHRKRMYSPTPNAQEELWRRAFWILMLLEWMQGYGFGRPCSIHDEDFDLALPTECDDEYWLTPEGKLLFRQPPGQPSKVSGFVQLLRLGQILSFANRTIYATNKSRAQLGHSDQQWEQRVVTELDSALNKWASSLPSHLRWNPEQENELFLVQAAMLGAFYYLHQIAVHRRFMTWSSSSARRESPISPLSTIICVNAARSTIQVVEVVYNRTGSPTHGNMRVIFVAAMILMRNMLGLKRAGGASHASMQKDLALVGKTVEMLRALQYEMHLAETLGDVLADLAAGIADPPPPPPPPPPGASSRTGLQEPATYQADTGHASPRTEPTRPSDAPAHAEAALHAHLDIDFTLPGTPSFAIPLRSDMFGQGFAMPVDGPMQLRTTEETPLPPSALHAYGLGRVPAQYVPPPQLQPQSLDAAEASTAAEIGQGLFGIGTGQMFGPDADGAATGGSMPWHPLAAPQTGPHDNSNPQAAPDHDHLAAADARLGQQDMGIDDFFMFMDDTLSMWPGVSPIFKSDDWGGYFDNAGRDGAGS